MTYIPIGTITKPHGIKGALRVKTDSDFKETRYRPGAVVFLNCKGEHRPLTIQSHSEKGTMDIIKFEEFDHISEVENLRGCTLEIDEESREKLDEDSFYFDDLIGLSVYQEGILKGRVKSIQDIPQGALLRIEKEKGGEALVPFLKVFIEKVDLDAGEIHVHEVEGLL